LAGTILSAILYELRSKLRRFGCCGVEVTTMLDLMYLTIMKLTAVMAMTMFLMRTEIMKEAKTFAMTPTMLARFVMLTMVMETAVMALLTMLVAMTATMLVTHLPVVMLLVKEKKK
jgi:hypothetical protein